MDMDINELMKVNSQKVLDDLEDLMVEEALDTSICSLGIEDYEHLYKIFSERFDKSKPELTAIIVKVMADTLIQLQKDCIWQS